MRTIISLSVVDNAATNLQRSMPATWRKWRLRFQYARRGLSQNRHATLPAFYSGRDVLTGVISTGRPSPQPYLRSAITCTSSQSCRSFR